MSPVEFDDEVHLEVTGLSQDERDDLVENAKRRWPEWSSFSEVVEDDIELVILHLSEPAQPATAG